jgi:hypothetical protein
LTHVAWERHISCQTTLQDAIDADTFQVKEAIVEMGAFTWALNFYWPVT